MEIGIILNWTLLLVLTCAGRLEGFKKILLLLLEKDSELTTEIVKTIKQFLEEISIPTEDIEDAKQVVEIVSKPSLSRMQLLLVQSFFS